VPTTAAQAYDELLERGVIVRSGAGLGMPDRLRVTVGTPDENARFLDVLAERVGVWRSGLVPEPATVS
jgi:histidinol-phosphate aminotransferase